MIKLTATTDTLELKLAGAVATNQSKATVHSTLVTATDGVPTKQTSTTNNGSAVTACSAPGASQQKVIDTISLVNVDTAAITLTFQLNENGTLTVLDVSTLEVGDVRHYEHGRGWYTTDADGAEKGAGGGSSGITQLTGDVTAGPGSGSQAATIANGAVATAKIADDAVTYAKIQNVSATSRVLGRKTAGAGDTEELTLSEALDFIGSAAQGDILYRGAASWSRLGAGTSGQFLQTQGAGANPQWAAGGGGGGLPRGHIDGLILSNNVSDANNDIDVAVGKCRDSTDAQDMELASAITKRIDAAWAVGTNEGGVDSGSVTDNTWHVWLIKRSDTGVVDVLFSLSATAPTMPTNYDYKRRIGSITVVSSAIRQFTQNGDEFLYLVPFLSVNNATVTTTAQSVALTVPTGVKVYPLMSVYTSTSAQSLIITSLDTTDTAPGITTGGGANIYNNGGQTQVTTMPPRTNTSAQVRLRSTANMAVYIFIRGWIDLRGKN